MESFLENLKAACRYHTGFPRPRLHGPVYDFTSEREFVELLQEGAPVVVAFTVRCEHTRHLDRALLEASSEWSPRVKFLRVECPKYPGFCIARQRRDYPFVEVFQNSQVAGAEESGAGQGGSITRYTVSVLPYTYDVSAYGFREFFKSLGLEPTRKSTD